MDELRTTLNTVLDTVERELAAARDAGALLREVEKERDDLKRRNDDLAAEVALHREFACSELPRGFWFCLGAAVAVVVISVVSKL